MDRLFNNNLYDFNTIDCNNKSDNKSDNNNNNNNNKSDNKQYQLTMSEDKYTRTCHKLLHKNRLLQGEIKQNQIIINQLKEENKSINLKYTKLLNKFKEIKKN